MILVTGGTGFVGPKIVHALRARSHAVRALVRGPSAEKTLKSWGCELVQGDMTDADSLRRAAEGSSASSTWSRSSRAPGGVRAGHGAARATSSPPPRTPERAASCS